MGVGEANRREDYSAIETHQTDEHCSEVVGVGFSQGAPRGAICTREHWFLIFAHQRHGHDWSAIIAWTAQCPEPNDLVMRVTVNVHQNLKVDTVTVGCVAQV